MVVFIFLQMIEEYNDSKQVREVFSKEFGMACRVLGVKLNEGYDSELEKEDEENKDSDGLSYFDLEQPETLIDETLTNLAYRDNRRRFEDDVMTYLIIRSTEYAYSPQRFSEKIGKDEIEIYNWVNSVGTNIEKARVLQCNADFRLFGMASGFVPYCDGEKACSASCYRRASAFFEEREGRSSQKAQILDKLGVNFQRYFLITKNAFEISLNRVNASQSSDKIYSDSGVDELLEALNHENNHDRRLELTKILKEMVTDKNILNNIVK